jgi:hypothetical protein
MRSAPYGVTGIPPTCSKHTLESHEDIFYRGEMDLSSHTTANMIHRHSDHSFKIVTCVRIEGQAMRIVSIISK